MTTIIKNGTVVTADLTYKADVRVENGVITEIILRHSWLRRHP